MPKNSKKLAKRKAATKKLAVKRSSAKKRSKKRMAKKPGDDDEHTSKQQHQHEQDQGYREPERGSTQPRQTTMANPGPENKPFEPEEPTADPLAAPKHSSLPNPPSAPGGDVTGEPNVTATGEKLPKDHPDYRPGYEGKHAPDHRSQAEKEADAHKDKPKP